MASVKRVETSKGTRYRARWRSPEGKSREQWFDRKVDAERHLTSVEHRKLTGAYVDPGAGKTTVEVYGEQWRAIQVHRPSTAAQVETNLRKHVYPHLGGRAIGAVRTSEIQAWVTARSKHLAPATVEVVYRYLAAIFRAAVADRIITASPCVGIRLPKQEPTKVEPITLEQFQAIVAGLPDRYKTVAMVAAGSGLRQGEVFGLTVDRIDFLRRRITVDRQLLLMPSGPPEFGPLKTSASYRTVPGAGAGDRRSSGAPRALRRGHDGLVFTNDDGNPIRRTRFSDVWRPAAKAAGLEPGTGMHALRHFYASALIHHGESVKVVQDRLGQATAAETLDTYSHLWPDSEDKTRNAVSAVLGDVGLAWGQTAAEG